MILARLPALGGLAVLLAFLAAGPALAQAPSKEHIAAARAMMERSGAMRGFDQIVANFLDETRVTIGNTRPELAKDAEEITVAIAPEFMRRIDDLLNTIAASYARRFSIEELRQIEAFYKTPAGQKWVQMLPGVLQEAQGATREWGQKVSEEIVTRVRQEMKKRGKDM